MSENFWFNRFIEYWNLPDAEDIVDHVRRASVPLVQCGNFGPDFYALADDPEIERSWAGLPVLGIEENLERAAELIPRVQEAGARVVGQLTMTVVFGEHRKRLGLFGDLWNRLWTPARLGSAPAATVDEVVQVDESGAPLARHIEGRPYQTYRGCVCNPAWRQTLKAMVDKGLDLGLDGFNAIHNYESFCHCTHCAVFLRQFLAEHLKPREAETLFGLPLEEVANPQQTVPEPPEDLQRRHQIAILRAAALARKKAFDEIFIEHGRGRRPSLLLAQWYHKYDLRVNDERSSLPPDLWARGESYVWYSQGPHKWGSALEQGYLADMGLPSRFMYAAGGGRPFVVNKYDYRRWRVWGAEAMAHGGAALAFHAGPPRAGQEDQTRVAPEDYFGPVIRYQRFMAEHEQFLHPARPWSQVALVYPRRAEIEGEPRYLDALKRIGEWLEDAHVLFDIILDFQLVDRACDYHNLILPEVTHLSTKEVKLLKNHVRRGGSLLLTGATGTLDLDGQPLPTDPFSAWRHIGQTDGAKPVVQQEDERVFYLPEGPWQPDRVHLRTLDAEMPVYPRLHDDAVGQHFVNRLEAIGGPYTLKTDAPWYVRVRAWRPDLEPALVLHWINYLQDERAAIETPIPIGPLKAECRLPKSWVVKQVEWRYPEMKSVELLEWEMDAEILNFSIPRLIVHGMAVIHLA